jgi:hypothetical protein
VPFSHRLLSSKVTATAGFDVGKSDADPAVALLQRAAGNQIARGTAMTLPVPSAPSVLFVNVTVVEETSIQPEDRVRGFSRSAHVSGCLAAEREAGRQTTLPLQNGETMAAYHSRPYSFWKMVHAARPRNMKPGDMFGLWTFAEIDFREDNEDREGDHFLNRRQVVLGTESCIRRTRCPNWR